MSIYIITHKPFDQPRDDYYKVLLVGAYRGHVYGDCFDDEGEDNISQKNDSYCELTGLYWIWKNVVEDIIGIVHYRRYFSARFSGNILTKKEVEKILSSNDIILPNRVYLRENLCDQLRQTFPGNELNTLRQAIKLLHPEYLDTYESVMNGNMVYFCNMMVCCQKLFNKYCEWVFPIIQEVEKHIDISNYNSYQKRIYGFLTERLLTVWVIHNKLKICEIGMVCTEEKENLTKKILNGIRRRISYLLPKNRTIDKLLMIVRKPKS